jgi:hypothetical protein
MNNSNFTSFCLASIGNNVICKKTKKYIPNLEIYEYEKGDLFKFVGFIYSIEERTVILESKCGSQECLDWRDFKRFFVCLQTRKFALAGH